MAFSRHSFQVCFGAIDVNQSSFNIEPIFDQAIVLDNDRSFGRVQISGLGWPA